MIEDSHHNTGPRPGEPTVPAAAVRGPTVLQVLPALGAGGGVERGTIEIARAIVEAGGRALVASAGGAMVHEVARARAVDQAGDALPCPEEGAVRGTGHAVIHGLASGHVPEGPRGHGRDGLVLADTHYRPILDVLDGGPEVRVP